MDTQAVDMGCGKEIARRRECNAGSHACSLESIHQSPSWDVVRPDDRIQRRGDEPA